MVIQRRTSSNFYRNLNSKASKEQIERNTIEANSEVLNAVDRSYMPVKSGKLKQSKRVNSLRWSGGIAFITTTWQRVYAGIRYKSNKTNPDKTFWVRRAYKEVRQKAMKIMRKDVVE